MAEWQFMTRKETKDFIDIKIDFGTLNPKQKEFMLAQEPFIGYGGARGGGKTHAVRIKAFAGALYYPGIRILIIRRTYPELEQNHISPMKQMIPKELATYKSQEHEFVFKNGSVIKFGHWASDDEGELHYQGQEWHWIMIDEATQLSERAFRTLMGINRSANDIPKRMYLTANPGGVGHRWYKRLFIDRKFKRDPDPLLDENPKDYAFIFATVEDNDILMEKSPNYVKMLNMLPESIRMAHRFGSWDLVGGSYFKEFSPVTHVVDPFNIPDHWKRYISCDYGLDMLSVMYWAVDTDGRAWCIKHFEKSQLVVSKAADAIRANAPPNHMRKCESMFIPPDLFNKNRDSGKSTAITWMEADLPCVKVSNDRINGWFVMSNDLRDIRLCDRDVKDLVFKGEKNAPVVLPRLMFFRTKDMESVIGDLQDIQADEKNPNDCATEPHELTHNPDAIRYFCISWQMEAEAPKNAVQPDIDPYDELEEEKVDMESYMCGGDLTEAYLSYG